VIKRRFSPGDIVIYRKLKCTTHPGPRATHVTPAPRGEDYVYHVDKFWIVVEEQDDETLVVLTRRGKRHCVRRDDPKLRRPSLWERIRYGYQFPRPTLLKAVFSPNAQRRSLARSACSDRSQGFVSEPG
jgi:hypothetical protein